MAAPKAERLWAETAGLKLRRRQQATVYQTTTVGWQPGTFLGFDRELTA